MGETPERLRVFRGVRNLRNTFGSDDPASLVGREFILEGFAATSIHSDVALREFTSPRGALLEIDVPDGLRALWVAGDGDRRLRYQGELLLDPGLLVRVTGSRLEGDLRVLSCEVIA